MKYSFKEKLEMMESLLSIIVSLIAIYGTVASIQSGFWNKLIANLEKDLVKVEENLE